MFVLPTKSFNIHSSNLICFPGLLSPLHSIVQSTYNFNHLSTHLKRFLGVSHLFTMAQMKAFDLAFPVYVFIDICGLLTNRFIVCLSKGIYFIIPLLITI